MQRCYLQQLQKHHVTLSLFVLCCTPAPSTHLPQVYSESLVLATMAASHMNPAVASGANNMQAPPNATAAAPAAVANTTAAAAAATANTSTGGDGVVSQSQAAVGVASAAELLQPPALQMDNVP